MPIRVGIVSAFVPLILQFLLGSQNKGHANINGLTLLVGRQEGHLACKKLSGGLLRGYLSGARCRLAYGPADAAATHCLLF